MKILGQSTAKILSLLEQLKTQAEYDRHKDFTLALGNVQSIKNKDDIIAEFLHNTKPDGACCN